NVGRRGGVGPLRRRPWPPPGVLGRLESAVRNEDTGRIGLLALRSRRNALAVAAEVACRATHVRAGRWLRHRLHGAAGAVRLADAVAAVRVGGAPSGSAGADAAVFGLRVAGLRRRVLADAPREEADR